MKTTLEIPDELALFFLQRAKENKTSFEEEIQNTLGFIRAQKLGNQPITENEIVSIVASMRFSSCCGDVDRKVKASEIFESSTGRLWSSLHPSSRKSIGRQFANAVRDPETIAYWNEAGKNINNASLYKYN